MKKNKKLTVEDKEHLDQSVAPISLCDIPIEGKVNHIDNTGNNIILK